MGKLMILALTLLLTVSFVSAQPATPPLARIIPNALEGSKGCSEGSVDGYTISVKYESRTGSIATISLDWSAPLGHPESDWAALYMAGSCPIEHTCYLHCCWETLGPYANNTITFDASSLAPFINAPYEIRLFSEGTYSPIIRSCQFRLPGYSNFDTQGYKSFANSLPGHSTPPPRASSDGSLPNWFSVVIGETLVVLGGSDRAIAILDDVWITRFTDSYADLVWSPVQVLADPTYGKPMPRIGANLAVSGKSIYMFGGYTNLTYPRAGTNSVWRLQLSDDLRSGTWAPVRTFNEPQGRYGAAGVLVSTSTSQQSLWVFGGSAADAGGDRPTQILGGIGELDLSSVQATWQWEEVYKGISFPLRLFGHVALYNPRSNEIFVYGGRSLGGMQSSAYVMSLKNRGFYRWSEFLTTGVAPPPLMGMTLDIYVDPSGVQVLLFGGRDAAGQYSNRLFQLDYASKEWTLLQVPGQLPPPRASHVSAIYAVNAQVKGLLVWAGRNEQFLQDTWLFEFGAQRWLQLPNFSPEGRYDHSANEVKGGKMVVFGGVSSRLAVPPLADADASADGTCAPAARAAPLGRIMFNDMWEYTLLNQRWQWQLLRPSGLPPARRAAHATTTFSNKLLLMNGLAEDGTILGDAWQYDSVTNVWAPLPMNQTGPNAPPPLYRHFLGLRGRSLIVYGGVTPTGVTGGLWSWSFATAAWTILDGTSATGPGARYGVRAALYGTVSPQLFVYGGFRAPADGTRVPRLSDTDADGLADVWLYDFDSALWMQKKPMPISDNFGGSSGYSSSALVGGQMLLFGTRRRLSKAEGMYSNSYAQYSIADGTYEWQPQTTQPNFPVFPSARAGATLVAMTTQAAVLFGGVNDAGAMNDLWTMKLEPVCGIAASASARCFPCVPGTFFNAGKCNACAQGQFSQNVNQKECTSCPPGFYGIALGASHLSQCVPCAAGTYSSGTGDITCRACTNPDAYCPLAAPKLTNLRPTADAMKQVANPLPDPPKVASRRRAEMGQPSSMFISAPDLLTIDRVGFKSLVIALLAAMVFFGFVIGLVMYALYKVKYQDLPDKLAPFDWFRLHYTTTKYFPLYPKHEMKGFSVSLVCIVWMVCVFLAVAYTWVSDNTRENVAVLPFVLQSSKLGSNMYFEARFYGVRGKCQDKMNNGTTCSSAVTTSATGFSEWTSGEEKMASGTWDCAMQQNEFCRVTWTCANCTLAVPVVLGGAAYSSKQASSLSVSLGGDKQYASSVTAQMRMGSSVPSADSLMSTMMTAPMNHLYSGGQAHVIVEALPAVFSDYRNDTNLEGNLFTRGWRMVPPLVDASTLHEKESIGVLVDIHRDASVVSWTRSEAQALIGWVANLGGAWAFVLLFLLMIFSFFRTIDENAQYKKKEGDFWNQAEALEQTRNQMLHEQRITPKESAMMHTLIQNDDKDLRAALMAYAMEDPETRGEEGRFDAYWRVVRSILKDALRKEENETGEIDDPASISHPQFRDETENDKKDENELRLRKIGDTLHFIDPTTNLEYEVHPLPNHDNWGKHDESHMVAAGAGSSNGQHIVSVAGQQSLASASAPPTAFAPQSDQSVHNGSAYPPSYKAHSEGTEMVPPRQQDNFAYDFDGKLPAHV